MNRRASAVLACVFACSLGSAVACDDVVNLNTNETDRVAQLHRELLRWERRRPTTYQYYHRTKSYVGPSFTLLVRVRQDSLLSVTDSATGAPAADPDATTIDLVFRRISAGIKSGGLIAGYDPTFGYPTSYAPRVIDETNDLNWGLVAE